MYLIVGLGNPGKEYENTRHNAGFMVIDELSKMTSINVSNGGFFGLYGSGVYEGEKYILLKPETFMNLSGKSIRAIMDYKKIEPQNLIVIYDDIDIEVGKLRIRPKGSAGSHNGMKSIIEHIGTGEFARVRVGIGKNIGNLADYVLSKFSNEEKENLAIKDAAKATLLIAKSGVEKAQSEYN